MNTYGLVCHPFCLSLSCLPDKARLDFCFSLFCRRGNDDAKVLDVTELEDSSSSGTVSCASSDREDAEGDSSSALASASASDQPSKRRCLGHTISRGQPGVIGHHGTAVTVEEAAVDGHTPPRDMALDHKNDDAQPLQPSPSPSHTSPDDEAFISTIPCVATAAAQPHSPHSPHSPESDTSAGTQSPPAAKTLPQGQSQPQHTSQPSSQQQVLPVVHTERFAAPSTSAVEASRPPLSLGDCHAERRTASQAAMQSSASKPPPLRHPFAVRARKCSRPGHDSVVGPEQISHMRRAVPATLLHSTPTASSRPSAGAAPLPNGNGFPEHTPLAHRASDATPQAAHLRTPERSDHAAGFMHPASSSRRGAISCEHPDFLVLQRQSLTMPTIGHDR